MNRYTLELRISVEISSNKSGNEKLKQILADVDAYTSALLQQHDVSGRSEQLPPTTDEVIAKVKDWFGEYGTDVSNSGMQSMSMQPYNWVKLEQMLNGNCH